MSTIGAVRDIMQIGDVSFHAHAVDYTPIKLKAKGKSETFQDHYRVLPSKASWKPEISTAQIKLQLFNDGAWSHGHIVQRLTNLLGRPVDIFAYEVVRTETQLDVCGCPVCDCCQCELIWLHNRGVLRSVDVDSPDFREYTMTLTLEYHSYWKPVNRLIWEWKDSAIPRPVMWETPLDGAFTEEIKPYPTCEDLFGDRRCGQWYKRCRPDLSFMYDPDWFIALHCYHRNNYPPTGYTSGWSNVNKELHYINIDAWRWSAPPLSVYVFKDFIGLDTTASIKIEYNDDAFCRSTDYVYIDFDALATIFTEQSFTPQSTDILVVGDVDGGAFILRDDTIALYVTEAITRTGGDWSGMLTPGKNKLRVSPNGATYAMHHYFRRMG